MINSARNRFILLTALSYATLALLWIFFSDRLLAAFTDIESIVWLSTAKGIFFVLVTAVAFFLALHAVPDKTSATKEHLLETLSVFVSPDRVPRWVSYSFAVLVTATVLVVRDSLATGFGNQPLMILFMFPIIFSALLGGLGPGLISTSIAALGLAYLAIEPTRSFTIGSSHDLLQWCFLIANGVAVSLLSEILRRSLTKIEFNRRLLDTVISGTPDAVFVKDKAGRYLLANAAAADFIGKPVANIIGTDDLSLFSEASARKVMTLDQGIIGSARTQSQEENLMTLTGKQLAFLVTKGPVFDDSGQVVGLFGIAREITERKRAEDEILRLNSELEHRVAERTIELQSANLELEELAYALTHNLRSPLRAINSFSQMLAEENGHQLNNEGMAKLAQVKQASDNMGQLIDGILALLRCSCGELRRELVDISALATKRLDQLARHEPNRLVKIEVEPGLIEVGDAAMLELAVVHLVDNAWKFTHDTANATIRVHAGAVDDQPGICISDNGAGFDMAHAERLFHPFQRLHRQDEFPGIGIGLATVQRIVRRHGGELRATAAPGTGATFCFSLPSPSDKEHHDE